MLTHLKSDDGPLIADPKIAFVSTMEGPPWGGSEELWSQAAADLARLGVSVSASVYNWSPPHQRVLELAQIGIQIWSRPRRYPFWLRVWRKMSTANELPIVVTEVQKLFDACNPALVVFSDASRGTLGNMRVREDSIRNHNSNEQRELVAGRRTRRSVPKSRLDG
jgi:hypothetical protein